MTAAEILAGGGIVLAAMTLIQIAPIKLDPWSAIELLRDIPHTQEEFVEILAEIDQYEKYCKANPDYQNNRTTHAVANISRVYDDRLIKHDFLREDEP